MNMLYDHSPKQSVVMDQLPPVQVKDKIIKPPATQGSISIADAKGRKTRVSILPTKKMGIKENSSVFQSQDGT
jgi:hypothetical protein